nr:MAG TPA: hypothetical protein [Caudoviricetes sp.]
MPIVGNVKVSVCLSTFKSPFHRCRQRCEPLSDKPDDGSLRIEKTNDMKNISVSSVSSGN